MKVKTKFLALPAALASGVSTVLAAGDGFEPPERDSWGVTVAVLIAIVAVLVILAVAFKNAKRTHLD